MTEFVHENIKLVHGDCMDYMKDLPDNAFDLAIVDPPYGIGTSSMAYLKEVKTTVKQKNGTRLNPNKNKKVYQLKKWDDTSPTKEYYNELKRISKNQIIWGIEYMQWDGIGSGRIKWNKGVPAGMSFKKNEMAYCSLINEVREINLLWAGMCQAKSLFEPMTQQGNKKLNERRIHPCQKPVLLYKRLLLDYATPDMKIIDTHGGSMSLMIACHDFGCEAVCCEIDKDYYDDSVKRFKNHVAQKKLF